MKNGGDNNFMGVLALSVQLWCVVTFQGIKKHKEELKKERR